MRHECNGELIPSGGGDNIPLIREKLTIGRRESCDICLRFPNVSGLHCELEFRDGFWVIRDLGSTNGVKVHGVKVKQRVLRDGDEVTIANRVFQIHYAMHGGQSTLQEILDDEENIMEHSLLERAGLVKPKGDGERSTSAKRGKFSAPLETDDDMT